MGIDKETHELKIDLRTLPEGDAVNATATTSTTATAAATATTDQCTESDGPTSATKANVEADNEIGQECKDSENAESASTTLAGGTSNGLSSRKSYKLTGVVCQINNASQKNLVALIYVGNRYHELRLGEKDSKTGQWYIFNDFR